MTRIVDFVLTIQTSSESAPCPCLEATARRPLPLLSTSKPHASSPRRRHFHQRRLDMLDDVHTILMHRKTSMWWKLGRM
jgi:hypothetical protein